MFLRVRVFLLESSTNIYWFLSIGKLEYLQAYECWLLPVTGARPIQRPRITRVRKSDTFRTWLMNGILLPSHKEGIITISGGTVSGHLLKYIRDASNGKVKEWEDWNDNPQCSHHSRWVTCGHISDPCATFRACVVNNSWQAESFSLQVPTIRSFKYFLPQDFSKASVS